MGSNTSVLGFRDFVKRLLRAKGWSYEMLARKLGTPDDLIQRRVKQIDHFLNDPEDGQPRAGFAKAIESALDIVLPAEEYGWDAKQP
jgi:ribosome-binding protein aMBF1 (putative translation factor)